MLSGIFNVSKVQRAVSPFTWCLMSHMSLRIIKDKEVVLAVGCKVSISCQNPSLATSAQFRDIFLQIVALVTKHFQENAKMQIVTAILKVLCFKEDRIPEYILGCRKLYDSYFSVGLMFLLPFCWVILT